MSAWLLERRGEPLSTSPAFSLQCSVQPNLFLRETPLSLIRGQRWSQTLTTKIQQTWRRQESLRTNICQTIGGNWSARSWPYLTCWCYLLLHCTECDVSKHKLADSSPVVADGWAQYPQKIVYIHTHNLVRFFFFLKLTLTKCFTS